jgi:hypothetical protein
MNLPKSIKVTDDATDFFKKLRLNIIRAGGSENSLTLSYADLMDLIVKYFKSNSISYTEMVAGIAKNV